MMNIDLDNRIYLLQQSNLPDELSRKVMEADTAYLRDNNSKATELINEVENECIRRGIKIAEPFSVKI